MQKGNSDATNEIIIQKNKKMRDLNGADSWLWHKKTFKVLYTQKNKQLCNTYRGILFLANFLGSFTP